MYPNIVEVIDDAWSNLKTGRSVFLSKETCQFLISYLNAVTARSAYDAVVVSAILDTICDFNEHTDRKKSSCSEARLVGLCMEVIAGAPRSFIDKRATKVDVVNQILRLLKNCPTDMVTLVAESFLKLVSV